MDRADMTPPEVADCVARAQRGDEAAALSLFHYMYPQITKLVYSNRPGKEGVEDLVQQSCIKIMSNLHKYSGRAPFLHWVSRVTVNTCLNQIRHEKARPEVRLADLSEEEAGVVERLAVSPNELDSSDQVASHELVEKLLAGLRAPDRLLMRMIYLDGLTLDEVAQLTGWNATVIKVRSFRARAQLRKRYRLLMKESP